MSKGMNEIVKEELLKEETEAKDAIRKENKKALKTFIPIIIAAGVFGGLFGFFSQTVTMQGTMADIGAAIGQAFYLAVPYLVILTEALTIAVSLVYYKKAKGLFAEYTALDKAAEEAGAGDEDEERLESLFQKTDRTLGISMVIMNMGLLVSFMFFGMFMSGLTRMLDADRFILPAVAILFFLGGMFVNIKLQQLAVDLIKRMNPKMQGSVYDVKFKKKWEESCDEAEMMTIYKASYKAFQTGNLTCTILWVLTCLGDMLLHFGALPVVIVSIIWISMQASYYIENFRLERGGING